MSEKLDLTTPDKARKALAELVSEQKRLKDANRNLSENMEAKTKALSEIQQRMSEMESASKQYQGSRGDGSVDRYVRRDGTLRLKGEATDEHAYMPGLLDDAPRTDWQADLQKAVDDYNMVKTIRRDGTAPKARARMMEVIRTAPPAVQKLYGDISGSGAEWIPDVMLPQLERNLTSARRMAGLFETVPMADKTVILPYLTTGFRPYKAIAAAGDDPAQYTSSSMTTAQRTITATGMVVRAQVDADASEDSILAAMPIIRQELVSALVDGEEDAIINGNSDTSGDVDALASWNIRSRWGSSGLGGSADHRKCWVGLRHRAFDVSSNHTPTAEGFADIMASRRQLDAPHGTEGDCVLLTSPEAYLKHLLTLSEVKGLDAFGANYTALSGQLAVLAGMPVIISDFMSADLATSGLYTGSGSTTSWCIFNRARFKLGVRAGAAVELDRDISRGVFDVVARNREIFYTPDASTTKNVALGVDIST